MKVSEMEGADLDYWVAKAIGAEVHQMAYDYPIATYNGYTGGWQFSRVWSEGGPLIEEYRVNLATIQDIDLPGWSASCQKSGYMMGVTAEELGDTPLQAACRSIVASVYGDGVPDE